jgi:hypothetical protein
VFLIVWTPHMRTSARRVIIRAFWAAVLLFAVALHSSSNLAIAAEFKPAEVVGWRPHAFKGETAYQAVRVDGREAVYAQCNSSASGLVFEGPIDLRETPILEWSWRVDETFPPGIDETVRAGDDYPARVYVVKDGGMMRWRTRAMNYVWASAMPAGRDWPNAYASQAHMVSLRSGPSDRPGQWKTERRNVREDFRRYHGIDIDNIDAVAVMTDCDDLGTTAQAWYGTLRFLPAD